MPRAKSCACNWQYVGETLGWVWFRGSHQRFVAVRPDGTVVGARYRSRVGAVLALVTDARSREGLGGLLQLAEYRPKGENFARGIVAMLTRTGVGSN